MEEIRTSSGSLADFSSAGAGRKPPPPLALNPLSLIVSLMRHSFRSSAALTAEASGAEAPPHSSSAVGIGKPEFLQLRDRLIRDGVGPADIVFGPDLFDPEISETHAPYSDAIRDPKSKFAKGGDKPVADLFQTDNEAVIQKKIREHLSQVRTAREKSADPDPPGQPDQFSPGG
jgi:hypothetical protein